MPAHPERVRKHYDTICPNCENDQGHRRFCPICKGLGTVNLMEIPAFYKRLILNESNS